jgi:hypothetical protein
VGYASPISGIALGRAGFRFSDLEVIEMRGKRKLKVVSKVKGFFSFAAEKAGRKMRP